MLGYVVYGAYYFVVQDGMIFPAGEAKPPAVDIPAESPEIRVFFPRFESHQVEAWYLPPVETDSLPGTRTEVRGMNGNDSIPATGVAGLHDMALHPAPLLVVAHGNKNLIDDWPAQLEAVREAGWGALLVEYPGYGRSPGHPGQRAISGLFAAAYDSVMMRGLVDTSAVVSLGRSLGGGVACAFAAEHRTDALILVSTFTSVRAFARDYWLPGFLVKNPFDNLAVLKTFPNPVLLVHARDDTMIPYAHALALHAACPHDTLVTRDSGGHDTLQGHWDQFWEETGLPFLEQVKINVSGWDQRTTSTGMSTR